MHLASALYVDESRSYRDKDRNEGNRGLGAVVLRIVMALFDKGRSRLFGAQVEDEDQVQVDSRVDDFFHLIRPVRN